MLYHVHAEPKSPSFPPSIRHIVHNIYVTKLFVNTEQPEHTVPLKLNRSLWSAVTFLVKLIHLNVFTNVRSAVI